MKDKINSLLGQDMIILKHSDNSIVGELNRRSPLEECPTMLELLNLIKDFPGVGEYYEAHVLFVLACYNIVALTGSKTIVEVGTLHGLSSSAFMRALGDSGHLISFDPNMSEIVWDWMPSNYEDLWTRYTMTGQAGYNAVKDRLDEEYIDLLFIDAAHDYNDTQQLLNGYWLNKIRPGGYIALDDCTPQFQAEVNYDQIPEHLYERGNLNYGVLRALLEFTKRNNDRIEYAFIINTVRSTGFGVIKLR